MKKKMMVGILSTVMVMSMSITAFAGQWQSDANGWWYQNDDGSYPTNTWQWIDGNNDGTAESYYFNPQGYCLMNATTPDGYTVNPAGAWVVDGVVQTKVIEAGNTMPDTSNIDAVSLWDMQPVASYLFSKEGQQRTAQNALWSNVLKLSMSNARVEFYAGGQYKTLTMTLAPGERFSDDSEKVLEIYGDDDTLLDSFEVNYKTSPTEISVDISGQNYIKLVSAKQKGGSTSDCLLLKNAQFQ